MTHAGTSKPLYLADKHNRNRFQAIADANNARIVYKNVTTGFTPNLPKGSFQNEIIQRRAIQSLIQDERAAGAIPTGSLIIESDLDEIISRDTLRLLSACHVPQNLHLNVRNYRYSYNQPLMDGGYWRPRAVTIGHPDEPVIYTHARESDSLLADAGWHCSFCFPTLEDMRTKMRGYVHNDRLTRDGLLEEKALRQRVCRGQDPFGMWAVSSDTLVRTDKQEAFTFRDILIQSGDVQPTNSFLNLPVALGEQPGKFGYLLDKGCERPDQ